MAQNQILNSLNIRWIGCYRTINAQHHNQYPEKMFILLGSTSSSPLDGEIHLLKLSKPLKRIAFAINTSIMKIQAKICGLQTSDSVDCAVEAGASMVGFVFFPPSPRSISISDAATLTSRVPDGVKKVALTVNADDTLLADIVKNAGVDILQLHGNEEPERVFEIRHTFGLPVIKALPVEDQVDLMVARGYDAVVDYFLFDARPPSDATRPGGNAVAFDWKVLNGFSLAKPWLLAGGLTPENVAEAAQISGAHWVDVSSGVEDAPGNKNLDKIRQFLRALEPR